MANGATPVEATLLDILIDGFEKNETSGGFHWRTLPMPDEAAAIRKFAALTDEGRAWKGPPTQFDTAGPRRLAAWPDLEIRQVGRGIMARARAPGFDAWWHERATWQGDPIGPLYDWLEEERRQSTATRQ